MYYPSPLNDFSSQCTTLHIEKLCNKARNHWASKMCELSGPSLRNDEELNKLLHTVTEKLCDKAHNPWAFKMCALSGPSRI